MISKFLGNNFLDSKFLIIDPEKRRKKVIPTTIYLRASFEHLASKTRSNSIASSTILIGRMKFADQDVHSTLIGNQSTACHCIPNIFCADLQHQSLILSQEFGLESKNLVKNISKGASSVITSPTLAVSMAHSKFFQLITSYHAIFAAKGDFHFSLKIPSWFDRC